LPSTLTDISNDLFRECGALRKVYLYEGLQAIGERAFRECTSLVQINIPSTVTSFGEEAFCCCKSLKTIHLCEGIQTIDDLVFYSCESLRLINIPSTVTSIGDGAFAWCTKLMEVNLSEGLVSLGAEVFESCRFLLHLNIPSTLITIGDNAFKDCDLSLARNIAISPSSTLGQAYFERLFGIFAEVDCTFDNLRKRFDGLPIHQLCFYHAHQSFDYNNAHELIKNIVGQPVQGCQVDCLGMTPLHILSCSGTHDRRLYRCIIDTYPDALIMKDKWGEVPLYYAMFSESPMEVIHFFLETHQRKWGTLPLDFGKVLLKLAMCAKSAAFIRGLIRAQRRHLPGLQIDWNQICYESRAAWNHLRVYRVFVEADVSTRVNCTTLAQRRRIDRLIEDLTQDLLDDEMCEEEDYDAVRELVVEQISLYHRYLIDAMTMLELALWKVVLTKASSLQEQQRLTRSKKKQKMEPNSRLLVRRNYGQTFQVVIPNVLKFL